jgi:hypothetical protein
MIPPYSIIIDLEYNTDYAFLEALRRRYGNFSTPAHLTVVANLDPGDLQVWRVKDQLRLLVTQTPQFTLNFQQLEPHKPFNNGCVAIPIHGGGHLELLNLQ